MRADIVGQPAGLGEGLFDMLFGVLGVNMTL